MRTLSTVRLTPGTSGRDERGTLSVEVATATETHGRVEVDVKAGGKNGGWLAGEDLGLWLDPLTFLGDGEVWHVWSFHPLVNVLIVGHEPHTTIRFLDYLQRSAPLSRLLALLTNLVCDQCGNQFLSLLRQV